MPSPSSPIGERHELLALREEESLRSQSEKLEASKEPNWIRRLSKRLVLIHLLHLVLACLALTIFLVGLRRLEHNISVDVERAGEVTSSLTVGFQVFFTGYLFLLYWLSRDVGIDDAIRHPRTLFQLDFRIRAWGGLVSSLMPIWKNYRTSRRISPFLLGVLLYFASGMAVQLASSGILGVSIYNVTETITVTDWDAPAHNHMGDYSGLNDVFGNRGSSISTFEDQSGLWQAARQNMFLPYVNDTMHPGLQGNLMHDIMNTTRFTFDTAMVNATKMNVRCSQPSDAQVQLFLLPKGVNDTSQAIYSDENDYLANWNETETDDSVWLNVSMPAPPYWDPEVPGLNFSTLWGEDPYMLEDPSLIWPEMLLPTRVILQPWAFPANREVTIGHHQVVFALITGDARMLLRDSANSTGRVHNFTLHPGKNMTSCMSLINNDTANLVWDGLCSREAIPSYVQLIGCDFHTTQHNVSVTNMGFLSGLDSKLTLPPTEHEWEDFEWEEQREVLIDQQFLITFSPAASFDDPKERKWRGLTGAERLLRRTLGGSTGYVSTGMNLTGLEHTMEQFSASYFWNYWRSCDYPLPYAPEYYECDSFRFNFRIDMWDRFVGADLTREFTRARLEVIMWRAGVTLGCSVLLAGCALALLGVREDGDEKLLEAGFVDTVALLRDSSLTTTLGEGKQVEDVRIRYRHNPSLGTSHLDAYDR